MSEGSPKKLGLGQVGVTVTPNRTPSGKDVPCKIDKQAGATADIHHDVIFLDFGQDYEITFSLSAGEGVTAWSATPFGNMQGQCPPIGQGPTPPFKLSATNPSANSITVHIDGVAGPYQVVQQYRLNFNDDLTCDPIIIIGQS